MATLLPREFRGQKCLVCYSPQGQKESDMTERLTHKKQSSTHMTHIQGKMPKTSMYSKQNITKGLYPSLRLRNRNCQHVEHLLFDTLCPFKSQGALSALDYMVVLLTLKVHGKCNYSCVFRSVFAFAY